MIQEKATIIENNMEKNIKNIIDKGLSKRGLKMTKMIRPSSSSLFYYSPALYEYRTIYSLKEEQQLSKEGWYLGDDIGVLLWNILTEAIY